MKVILGLGNPGKEYEHTRHNVGWWLIDHVAEHWGFDGWKKDGQSKVAQDQVPIGDRIGAHPPVAGRCLRGDLWPEPALVVEQLRRAVAL